MDKGFLKMFTLLGWSSASSFYDTRRFITAFTKSGTAIHSEPAQCSPNIQTLFLQKSFLI